MPDLDHPAPKSKTDLFFSFSALALQGFGGVLAIIQRELVEEKRWLTSEEFLEDWAVAQILPGSNVVNLSLMIGDRYFGMAGALAALAGMLVFPLAIVMFLAVLFANISDVPQVQGALRGLGAVAAGLITGTGLKLAGGLYLNLRVKCHGGPGKYCFGCYDFCSYCLAACAIGLGTIDSGRSSVGLGL